MEDKYGRERKITDQSTPENGKLQPGPATCMSQGWSHIGKLIIARNTNVGEIRRLQASQLDSTPENG